LDLCTYCAVQLNKNMNMLLNYIMYSTKNLSILYVYTVHYVWLNVYCIMNPLHAACELDIIIKICDPRHLWFEFIYCKVKVRLKYNIYMA
jgi:hypothetical protein